MLGAANDEDSDEIDTDLDDGDDAGIDVDDYYEEEDLDAVTDNTTKMPSARYSNVLIFKSDVQYSQKCFNL